MTKEFEASKPIYLQIVDHIAFQMVRGDIKRGEKLPSVREMAIQSGVNPNTIQRTYSEMERMGIVESKRGQGTFATKDEHALEELKIQLQTEIIDAYVKNMEELGLSKEEMIDGLRNYLRGENDGN